MPKHKTKTGIWVPVFVHLIVTLSLSYHFFLKNASNFAILRLLFYLPHNFPYKMEKIFVIIKSNIFIFPNKNMPLPDAGGLFSCAKSAPQRARQLTFPENHGKMGAESEL